MTRRTNDTGSQFLMKGRPNQTKPLPPDPDLQNANRARSAGAALEEFHQLTGTDFEDAVSDLLANLMHWCDRAGQDFDQELRRARSHYAAETAAGLVAAMPTPDDI